MRPRGEIRAALSGAAEAWAIKQAEAEVKQGVTWRQLAEMACVGYAVARCTVKNMVYGGELKPCGQVRVPGSKRPMAAYWPADTAPTASAGLDDVLNAWGRN